MLQWVIEVIDAVHLAYSVGTPTYRICLRLRKRQHILFQAIAIVAGDPGEEIINRLRLEGRSGGYGTAIAILWGSWHTKRWLK